MRICPSCHSKKSSRVVDLSRNNAFNLFRHSVENCCDDCGFNYVTRTFLGKFWKKYHRIMPIVGVFVLAALCFTDYSKSNDEEYAYPNIVPSKNVIAYEEETTASILPAVSKVQLEQNTVSENALHIVPKKEEHSRLRSGVSEMSMQVLSRVEETVVSWRDSWQTGNLHQYFSHYSSEFDTSSQNAKTVLEWQKKRGKTILNSEKINIDLDNIRIAQVSEDLYIARFTQYYKSSTYSDVVEKELRLIDEEDGMKIISEAEVSDSLPIDYTANASI